MKTITPAKQLRTIEIEIERPDCYGEDLNDEEQDEHPSSPGEEISFEAYDKLLFEGVTKRQSGSIFESLSFFDNAIATVPGKAYASDALFEKAVTLEMLGFYHEAIGVLEELLHIHYSNTIYHYHLGLCESALGNNLSALSHFREALTLGDTSAELRKHLLDAYAKTGILAEIKYLQAA